MSETFIAQAIEGVRKAKDAPAQIPAPVTSETDEICLRLRAYGYTIDPAIVDMEQAKRLLAMCGETICRPYGSLPPMVGRGRLYDGREVVPEIAEDMLDYLRAGKSLRKALNREGMPSRDVWYKWLDTDEKLRDRYNAARRMRGTYLAELIEDASLDLLQDPNPTNEKIAAFRASTDKVQWTASKLNREDYGEFKMLALDASSNFVKALEKIESASGRAMRSRDAIDLEAAD